MIITAERKVQGPGKKVRIYKEKPKPNGVMAAVR